jgi:hypothetical protein
MSSRVRLAPCILRTFVYESYLPHLEVQQKSGAFFGKGTTCRAL